MNTEEKNIGFISKGLLIIAGMLLLISLFTPIWRIELDAPQYPEGLALTIHANKISGDIEIINGLNHYIGMKTLHAEEFIEFTVLPYIISAYALACFLLVLIRKKKFLYILLVSFILFGIIAMVDFWRWEYNYGHNLDPTAAIIVPGMAYQPPLIGFKQLLNFGAYSIPDIGGWLFIISGLLMVIATYIELKKTKSMKKNRLTFLFIPVFLIFIISCSPSKPEPIKLNSDKCDFCGMTISNPKFAAEIITNKGRVYKFDDIICLINYKKDNYEKSKDARSFIANFLEDNTLLPTETAIYIKNETLKSPMGGNIAAFKNIETANTNKSDTLSEITDWNSINQ